MRTSTIGLAAAVVLLAILPGAPAVGADEAGDYVPIGEPLAGASDVASATEIEVGDHLDSLGGPDSDTAQRWYRYERQYPGSTVHFSATIGMLAADPWASDEIEVAAYAGSEECGTARESGSRRQGRLLTSYLAVPGPQVTREECAGAGAFAFSVTRGPSGSGLDIKSPLEIRVIEEPPAIDSAGLAQLDEIEPPAIDLSSPGEDVRGGRSFEDAVALEAGSYRGTLTPGETQIFSVPVGWGQYASAAVEFPPPNTELAAKLGDASRPVSLRLHAPTRAFANTSSSSSSYDAISESSGAGLTAHTLPMAWANRQSSSRANLAASLAGDHYLVVTLADDPTASTGEGSFEVPFVLGVEVTGKVRGTPEYDEGAELLGDPAAEDSETGPLAVVGLAAVGLGLLALIGAVWLAIRRRRGAAAG